MKSNTYKNRGLNETLHIALIIFFISLGAFANEKKEKLRIKQ